MGLAKPVSNQPHGYRALLGVSSTATQGLRTCALRLVPRKGSRAAGFANSFSTEESKTLQIHCARHLRQAEFSRSRAPSSLAAEFCAARTNLRLQHLQTCLSLDLCSAETTDVSSSLERESLNCYLCEHYLVRPAQPDELEADELSLNRAKQVNSRPGGASLLWSCRLMTSV